MKIKLLPFKQARKNSIKCHKLHLSMDDNFCIGVYKLFWKDNVILDVIDVDKDRYLCTDGYWYCKCCCEVIEDNEKSNC